MSSAELWRRLKSRLERGAADFGGVSGICVEDLTTGDGLSINGEETFPTASSIKIHVLTQLFCRAERGELDLTQRMRLTPDILSAWGGVLRHMEGEPELSLLDVAILMIIVSDNSATNLCIDLAGMDETNTLLREMGLKVTSLRRKMQDRDAIARGDENIATPEEFVTMLKLLYAGKPSPWVAEKVLKILSKQKHGTLNRGIPSGLVVANKPGSMERVRCDTGIVYLPRRPYAIAVMTTFGMEDAITQEQFIVDAAKMVHETMNVLDTTNEYGLGVPASTSR